MLNTLQRGAILPNLQFEWLDEVKSNLTNTILDLLSSISTHININEQIDIGFKIAKTIKTFDILNEDALKLQVHCLTAQGKHSLANTYYENFCNEYKKLYAENYELKFEEIITKI